MAAFTVGAALTLPAQSFADSASDEQAILDIWSTYTEARVAGDAETWLGLWDNEGIRLPPGAPAVDFATFAPGTPERFANPPASMEIKSEEVIVTGDWAFSRGNFTVNNALEGKFLTIFRRQDDGSWRIYRDAFNFNSE
ncbi:YybH family protein [Boseongicola aestuarii]|uniref:YybH family protein n=1 Tax=Boseongicola aestuarii TaxID=1470561 RepID=UPI001595ED84|nr:nuclear transport factor 2 family protein [Boseongicola aestuarii]